MYPLGLFNVEAMLSVAAPDLPDYAIVIEITPDVA
jgi:hypothetical protein